MTRFIPNNRDTVVIPPTMDIGYCRARDPYHRKVREAAAEIQGDMLASLAGQAAAHDPFFAGRAFNQFDQQQSLQAQAAQMGQAPFRGGLGGLIGFPYGNNSGR